MRIAVTGASGMIGSALVPHLRAQGHDVVRMVRRPAQAPDEVSWDPAAAYVDLDALKGADAVVHLAAAGIGDHRLTASYKRVVRQSRVQGTRTIAEACARLDPRPAVLVSASAIGYYGDTGDRVVDESAPCGEGFAAEVVAEWERSAEPARAAGVRVVHTRSGIILQPGQGAAGRMLPLFKLGLGGRLGSGQQFWSFVSSVDEVRALAFLLEAELDGPVNVTVPNPATNAEVTRAIAEVLHRPAILPVPGFALRAVIGEFSSEVLGSIRAVPRRLQEAGFLFEHEDIESVARTLA